MLGKPRIYLFSPPRLINSIKHEHSCKILYFCLRRFKGVSVSASSHTFPNPVVKTVFKKIGHKPAGNQIVKSHKMCLFFMLTRWICLCDRYPHAFLKKRRGYCNRVRLSVRPSVCPLCYLLLNHRTKFCELLTWMGRATSNIFWPDPLGPLGGVKRSNII